MASSQVEAASPVQEITDQAEETTRPCSAQAQKPETTTEEPKADIHHEEEDDDEIFGDENKEYSAIGDDLFKDEEDKEVDSPILSEDKPVPTYGRKLDPEDDDEDHDDEDEVI